MTHDLDYLRSLAPAQLAELALSPPLLSIPPLVQALAEAVQDAADELDQIEADALDDINREAADAKAALADALERAKAAEAEAAMLAQTLSAITEAETLAEARALANTGLLT